MSQIRKYNVGGTAQKQIVDEAPMTILGMHFDKETLKNAMLGQQADAYAQHMGFSPEQTKQFKEDLKIRVEEILNGTSYFTDNRELYVPENSSLPSSENLGWEKEKEGKTKSLRNRSIRVTNYLVSYMNDLGFRAERKNKGFYKVNNDRINSIFKDHIKKEGGNEFNQMWLDKDEYDPATKTRKMTNRAKALAEAIQLEIDKLNNDVNYRKGFDYLGQYDTDWNTRHSDVTKQLSEIKTTLQDGELTDDELETLSTKYGINFGDNSLLTTKQNIDTDKSVEIQTNYDAQQQEAAEQEAVQTQTQDGWQYHSPFATITPKYSYQGQLYDYDNLPEGVKATAETAMGRSSLASEYNIFGAPYVAWATSGFSGLQNGDSGELVITYSHPTKNEGKKFYYKPKDENTWQLVNNVTYPEDKQNGSWVISYTDNNGDTKTANLGVWTGEVSPLPTFTPTGDKPNDFYWFKQDVLHNTLLSKKYTERFKTNLKKILKKYQNANDVYYDAAKNAIVYKNGNSYIYATIKEDLRKKLNNVKLSPDNIMRMLETLELGEVKYGTLTPYEKQGGVLNQKDANFFTLLNSYKSGGSLIPKFQDGGWFNFWKEKYFNEQSLEFNHKGKPYNNNNTLGRSGGVYSNGTVNNNLTAQDIFNKRQEYYDSEKISADAIKALNSINSSNTNSNIEDLLKSYNDKVQQLHDYKKNATHAYGEKGAKDFNSTYNLLYPSSPIGYDETQSDIFGGNTYLRVANSFENDDDYSGQRNFKYTFNGNDYNIWMDQEGKLNIADNSTTENQTETRSEEAEKTDVGSQTRADQEQDVAGNLDLEFAQERNNKGRLNPNSTWFDSLLGVGFAIGSNTAQTKQLLNELDYLRKQTWYNHSPEMRDYVTERLAQINAGKYRSAVKNTSDATINNLAMQGAVSQGNDVISNATAQSQKVYDASRATNKAYQDANLERSVTNANDNMQRHITNELTKAKLKTDDLATIQTNLNNLLAEFKQNKINLADKEEQAKYQILQAQLQQKVAHNESVTEEIYGKRAKAILLNGVTDEEKIAEINNMDNSKAIEQASGQNSMFKKNYEDYKKKWMLDLYTNYYESIPAIFGSLNMPWIPGRGSKQQNPLITTSFKSGGKLTQSEKERIQRLKDYNKAKLEQAKAFHKKIDKQLDNFHKNHRQSAAGTLRLIEKSLGYK